MGRTLCVLLALAAGPAGARGAPRKPDPPLAVAASILPLADFARHVGGDRVRVEVLVPPGASPHTYEPTPAQLALLSRARVLVLNGVGLEFWADKVVAAAHNPRLIVIRAAAGLPILAGDRDAPGGNPHVWLSPLDAIHQVAAIRDGLARADPAGAEVYRANAERYIAQLEALDAEIRDTVATFRSRAFIAFHPAWVYFARDYGLTQAAVIEASPGREPSPAEIARIIRAAKAIGTRAIFAEPQSPTKAAQVIAEETGARVLLLDSLGRPPDYGYLQTMRYDLSQMAKALR